jgi:hypothetical protein
VTVSEHEAESERLIERLLGDPVLRARFRSDPVGTARDAGFEGVADEMAAGAGKALETLEVRESRSSLAGVMMAAAVEGVGAHESALGGGGGGADEIPGGGRAAGVSELLHDRNVSIDPDGIADLRAGRIDSRVVAVLSTIARDHKISVSSMMSDHPRLTTGGSVSNHSVGRAVDISVIDGQPVGPGNRVAREIAMELSRLPKSIRPTEIGSPWALPGAAYFTDGDHQNHLHIGFDDPAPGGAQPVPVELPDDGGEDADDTDDVSDGVGAADPGDLDSDDSDSDDSDSDDEDSDDDDEDDDNDSISDDPSDEEEGENSISDDPSDEEEGESSISDDPSDEEDEDDEDEGDDEDSDDEDSDSDDEDSDSDDEDSDSDDSDSDSDDSDSDSDDSDSGGDAPPANFDLGDVPGDYPGDNAPRQELAGWMGRAAQERGLPPELPVMASLVESNLTNIQGGDADSVGFFQMRVGIWNQGEYAGYPSRPQLQLKWFLDHAAEVKKQRVARGQSVTDPNSFGEWIADVERPAEQYRGRYQLRLGEARELLRGALKRPDTDAGEFPAIDPRALRRGG